MHFYLVLMHCGPVSMIVLNPVQLQIRIQTTIKTLHFIFGTGLSNSGSMRRIEGPIPFGGHLEAYGSIVVHKILNKLSQ